MKLLRCAHYSASDDSKAATNKPDLVLRGHGLVFLRYAPRMPAKDRTRRRLEPRQDRARASVTAILTAAQELLSQRGYARTTTNHIAARAGVNVALLYRYFAGKEAVVGALIEQVAQETGARLAEAMQTQQHAPIPVLVRALLKIMVSTPGDIDLHRELAEHVDITRRQAMLQQVIAGNAQLLKKLLRKRRAELRADLDLDATLFILQHAISRASEAAVFYRPKSLSLERALEAQVQLVVRMLMPTRDEEHPASVLTSAASLRRNRKVLPVE